jgi:hypothetical protein
MFFAAAGASNYRTGKYLAVVTIAALLGMQPSPSPRIFTGAT